jgi:hypothetical protein
VGAANALRNTSCPVSRNENDSMREPGKTSSRARKQAAQFAEGGNVLNLRGESKRRRAVTFLAIAQNKFTNRLSSSEADMNFRTTLRCYADK